MPSLYCKQPGKYKDGSEREVVYKLLAYTASNNTNSILNGFKYVIILAVLQLHTKSTCTLCIYGYHFGVTWVNSRWCKQQNVICKLTSISGQHEGECSAQVIDVCAKRNNAFTIYPNTSFILHYDYKSGRLQGVFNRTVSRDYTAIKNVRISKKKITDSALGNLLEEVCSFDVMPCHTTLHKLFQH